MYIIELLTTGGSVTRENLLSVLAFVIALIVSLVLHENAHGLVALWNGDPTAKQYGRISLNPLRHFDPVGLLMMLLVGFGWAKPVPVYPANYKKYKVGCITVAIAGIITNLLLAFLFALMYVALAPSWSNAVIEVYTNGTYSATYYLLTFAMDFALFMMSLNISLALFNIIPLYPLDGYRLLASFVNENRSGMRFLRRYSLYIMLGLVGLSYLADMFPSLWWISPLDLYIGEVGSKIVQWFTQFWQLFFN